MKFKFNFIKFLLTLFCLFAVCVGIYQLYSLLYKAVGTEYAVQINCEDSVKATGYFVRNEVQIGTGNSKYIDVTVDSGDKVARYGTIANVYTSEDSAKIQSEIRVLQAKIDELTSIVSSSGRYNEDISYASSIRRQALQLSNCVSQNNPVCAFEAASNLTTDIIKSKIVSGEITDYSDKLAKIKEEIAVLKSETSAMVNKITSPKSGYFSNNADGLEDKLNIDMTAEINDEVFEMIKTTCESANHITSGVVGKVVEGSDWRVCFKANADKFEKIKVGSVIYIRLPAVTDSKIKCTVVSLYRSENDVYMVLESNMVTGDLISQRVCDIDIIIDSYSGIRIDKNALRKIDGQNGVFVKSNGILRYRTVEILYIGSTYAVIKYDPLDTSGVQVFDEVVVRGSNLHNGKVVA